MRASTSSFILLLLSLALPYTFSFFASPSISLFRPICQNNAQSNIIKLNDAEDASTDESSPQEASSPQSDSQSDAPCPSCTKCDGSGRILGGLAAFPLTSWWPIKAYRPCPNYKGVYRRSGQSLDEIAFGREEGRLQQGKLERSSKEE